MAAEPPSWHAVPSRGRILEVLRPQGAFLAIVLAPLNKAFAA